MDGFLSGVESMGFFFGLVFLMIFGLQVRAGGGDTQVGRLLLVSGVGLLALSGMVVGVQALG